ncbi:hypothetical protein BC833DRAFT_590762 [Globomyces pollinis-pini]|nr:hypothetical protein BC833DRAFT_590762 [Globomyces pollinis-pini]
MVAKKNKSKRQTCRDRYKVLHRINEKHRKDRKDMKNGVPPKRSVSKKDPGIPNNYPFKQELLMKAAEEKLRLKEEKLKRREEKREKKNLLQKDLQAFVEDQELNVTPENSTQLQNNRILTLDKFYHPFQHTIEHNHVILITVDARDPLFSFSEDLFNYISKQKSAIVILNKVDVIPRESLEKWMKYFSKSIPVVPYSTTNHSIASTQLLLELLNSYIQNTKLEEPLNLGVIGYPQTGKSSLINHLQKNLNQKNIKLSTTPGIMFSLTDLEEESQKVLLRNYSKANKVPEPETVVTAILDRFKAHQLTKLYSLYPYTNYNDLLVQFGRSRNFIRRHGVVDTAGAARLIIQDWYQGRIPYYTNPVNESVGNLQHAKKIEKEFSLSKVNTVYNSNSLKSISDFEKLFLIKTEGSVPVDMELDSLPKGYKLPPTPSVSTVDEEMYEDVDEDEEAEDSENSEDDQVMDDEEEPSFMEDDEYLELEGDENAEEDDEDETIIVPAKGKKAKTDPLKPTVKSSVSKKQKKSLKFDHAGTYDFSEHF